ncbi:YceI family protein [Catenovulum sp. SM1970]|uniref:YceI family protein n=1 Tax=Marinifaba aquimaris TaxID=2741323 RepID=UPI001574E40B|nr:YceI family protein [Marinifaba aquimaris]NTS75589.1 YceI family protein [Marinifaba aquimaris]
MKKVIAGSIFAISAIFANSVQANDYIIDTKGAHASIEFKIKHLGYSWLTGRFNRFDGEFSYDASKPEQAQITVNIDPASIDSNHAERDKHLRSGDFLSVTNHKTSKFVSTQVKDQGNGKLSITGDFTLHGVTKSIEIDAQKVGEGKDPWGGYRVGFTGTTEIALEDFGIKNTLGPDSANVYLSLNIEGIRK